MKIKNYTSQVSRNYISAWKVAGGREVNYLIPQEWIEKHIRPKLVGKFKTNPCIDVYGPGPEGKLCKYCSRLIRKQYANTYRKCGLRKNTNGPGTDHKATWPACKKYEEESQI